MLLADTLKISPERALDLYYSTKVYEQMTDPKYGLQLMSDDYILEELIEELRETQWHKKFQFVSETHGLESIAYSLMLSMRIGRRMLRGIFKFCL